MSSSKALGLSRIAGMPRWQFKPQGGGGSRFRLSFSYRQGRRTSIGFEPAMASTVAYPHSFAYLLDPDSGTTYPGLRVSISVPTTGERVVDTVAQLDSGAELSLFDGALLVPLLGIDLMAGREMRMNSAGMFA